MPKSYEIYDNEEVQRATRRQAGRLAAGVIIAGCASVVVVLAALHYGLSLWLIAPALTALWTGTAWVTIKRLRLLRRVVWCVKLSEDRILGYNYERRPTALSWSSIAFVDFTDQGIFVRGRDLRQYLHVSDLFDEYTDLGHRILALADEHDVPLLLDGAPLNEVDLHEFCPFLADASSHRTY